jgi:hypothetical protein
MDLCAAVRVRQDAEAEVVPSIGNARSREREQPNATRPCR